MNIYYKKGSNRHGGNWRKKTKNDLEQYGAVRDLGFLQEEIDLENLIYILLNEQV
jgi:hypothetical protein